MSTFGKAKGQQESADSLLWSTQGKHQASEVLSYALEEPTAPDEVAEMDRVVAIIMARISGSKGPR